MYSSMYVCICARQFELYVLLSRVSMCIYTCLYETLWLSDKYSIVCMYLFIYVNMDIVCMYVQVKGRATSEY